MGKLAVVLLSDMRDRVKVEMALQFTLVALQERRLEDIRFFFFGPGVQVPEQAEGDPRIRPLLDALLESEIVTLACVFNARELGQDQRLSELEVTMKNIGTDLVDMVEQGYQVMTF